MKMLRQEGEHFKAQRPDLIILDLNLPKKNGIEVLREIKEDKSLKCIPVVILTTSNAEEDLEETCKLDANCYITKPVDLDEFIKVVKSIQNFWLEIVKLPPR
jgi:DNA-binding response OmpR family regulator